MFGRFGVVELTIAEHKHVCDHYVLEMKLWIMEKLSVSFGARSALKVTDKPKVGITCS